ncbi:hypothetical protein [Burkholderia glumae]|uniref:Uncharacterized protein n=1 Tax=Burkholderia glumae TaxID=337 RepID=A0AAP9XXQ0_BURGL|nr:hypothetical protein [Burkholderia glumae]AJY63510.1 hypothetical protein KS03_3740 [Burkholderia glumae LMG 2196 = ATCC 33617]MCM2484314.1 hypothetical protein [Burkholderia glumae]MCM2510005.1 hypothetical protein [Burkholderia glumae]MCM2539768.1 hypothetical protein [Burkholderia glumae]MCR1770992.1 hypothetical protein [Burkholderia glumae]
MTAAHCIVIVLATVGAAVAVAASLEAVGIGHVRIYFGADPLVCTVPAESTPGVTP